MLDLVVLPIRFERLIVSRMPNIRRVLWLTGGEHLFIENTKKLEKYIPCLKKNAIGARRSMTAHFTVHQRVKFYVRSLSLIKYVLPPHKNGHR